VERFNTKTFAEKKKISIQMAARKLRYEWFDQILTETNYQYVATAHHEDDQVESFIINLSRGTGLAGLHGILPKTGNIIRPLMFAKREMIRKFIETEKLNYREDSSNHELYYLRNRIRQNVLPELGKTFPGVRDNILNTIENVRHAEMIYLTAISEKSRQLLKEENQEVRISLKDLRVLTPLRTWLFELLRPYGFNTAICDQLAGSLDAEPGRFFHSETHRILLDRDYLIITSSRKEIPEGESYFIDTVHGEIDAPVKMVWSQVSLEEIQFTDNPGVAYVDLDKLVFPLEVRNWHRGDYFYPLGMENRKKLSDFFIDEKLSLLDKESAWLLCSKEKICWIIGHRLDNRFKITPSTTRILKIELK
jgi:tRNA(Ile)-lysidine synthase